MPHIFGTVRRLVPNKGFGFIRDDHTESEYFFHASVIESPGIFTNVYEGQKVEGDVNLEAAKGPRMLSLRLLS